MQHVFVNMISTKARLIIFTGLAFYFAACVVGWWHYVAVKFLHVFKDEASDK